MALSELDKGEKIRDIYVLDESDVQTKAEGGKVEEKPKSKSHARPGVKGAIQDLIEATGNLMKPVRDLKARQQRMKEQEEEAGYAKGGKVAAIRGLTSRITQKKYGGDDANSWAVFLDGRPAYTGLTKSEIPYYRRLVEAKLSKETPEGGTGYAKGGKVQAGKRALDKAVGDRMEELGFQRDEGLYEVVSRVTGKRIGNPVTGEEAIKRRDRLDRKAGTHDHVIRGVKPKGYVEP
jgi:hypothetical protein